MEARDKVQVGNGGFYYVGEKLMIATGSGSFARLLTDDITQIIEVGVGLTIAYTARGIVGRIGRNGDSSIGSTDRRR